MMRKFIELFSVNDPGWGNSHPGSGSKDAKDGQANEQAPKTEPGNPGADKPVETQPKKETSFLGSIFGSNDKTATPVAK